MSDSGHDRTWPPVHLRIGSERLAVGSGEFQRIKTVAMLP